MKYITKDKETGTIIDEFDTLEEAERAIQEYEAVDKDEDNYDPDYYEIYSEQKVK